VRYSWGREWIRIFNADIKTTIRYSHPTPENKKKAVNVLAAVFGGGSEKVANGQRE
jgi:hypothetical protein